MVKTIQDISSLALIVLFMLLVALTGYLGGVFTSKSDTGVVKVSAYDRDIISAEVRGVPNCVK